MSSEWIKEEIKGGIKKRLETNEIGNTTKLMRCRKTVLREMFIAINTYAK